MSRLIKDFIEVGDNQSLDALISRLTEIRDSLPSGADAQVKLRGDDTFGRHIAVAFRRPLTAEEAAVESRYGSCPVKLKAVA
jgi:hypothetical protein